MAWRRCTIASPIGTPDVCKFRRGDLSPLNLNSSSGPSRPHTSAHATSKASYRDLTAVGAVVREAEAVGRMRAAWCRAHRGKPAGFVESGVVDGWAVAVTVARTVHTRAASTRSIRVR